MRMAVLKVVCTPRASDDGKKRPERRFKFLAGLSDEADPAAIFRNGNVRAKAELGDEAQYYTTTSVKEDKGYAAAE